MDVMIRFFQENFTFFLMGVFVLYLLWDYYKTRNALKLLFIIPVALSLVMITPLVTLMTKEFFFVYRMALIFSCFVVSYFYFRGTRKRQAEQAEQQQQAEKAAKKTASQVSRANSPYKNKKKK